MVGVLVAAAAIALSACGSTTTASSTTTTTTTSTTMAPTVTNLTVTPMIRTSLLAAGAALHQLPVTDYTGLLPGVTYYAYDTSTGTYWAGAALVPSSTSTPAQVANQDDGSYLIFKRTAHGTWVAYNDGLGTIAGTSCSIVVPATVRMVWHWVLTAPCGGPPPG